MATRGVVAAGHERTAEAAQAVLREGGNAFDAMIAAVFTACVAEPVLISLGGGGFTLAMTGDGRASVFDFFAQTPRVKLPVETLDFRPITADFGRAQQRFEIGLGSIATPGLLRGLFAIHRELGHMPMREIVVPAVRCARDGVTVNTLQAYIFSIVAPIYTATPEARAIWGTRRGGEGLAGEGEVLRQPELADALEILAVEGDDLFYRGEMGRLLAEACRVGGGCLTMDDLEHYRVERREPLRVGYRDTEVLTNPPPSSGGLLVALALRLIEACADLRKHAFGSVAHLELVGLALEATDDVRRQAQREPGRICPDAGVLLDADLLERYRKEILGRAEALRGTTHVGVIDDRGNVATTTVSNGEGCGMVIPGTGIMPNNMLGEDDLSPHGFHRWEPDQRMTSMMTPTIVRCPGGRIVATGSGGSKRIRSAVLQVLINLLDHGMDVEKAVASPRLFVERDLLSIEGGLPEGAVERVCRLWPRNERWDRLNLFFGGAHTVEARAGGFRGAGDPRRGGVSLLAG